MAKATTDHDEIRQWAESKGGVPAAVDRTHEGGDVGIIRIMFPDNPQSEHKALVEISWDEFFEQFEESELALLYDENSLFSKIIGRDTAEHREHGEHTSRRQMREEGGGGGGQRSGGGSGGRNEGGKAKAESSGKGEAKQSGGEKGGESGRSSSSRSAGHSEGGKAEAKSTGKGGGKESGGEQGGESGRGSGSRSAGGSEGGKAEAKSAEKGRGKESGGEEADDLKSREYRDEQGNVHHHTRSYMEQHGKEK